MNKKGFTLIELLATLVILGIIAGITIISTMGGFGDAKEKTEKIFIGTIKDALDMYLDSDARNLTFDKNQEPECILSKTHGIVKVYKAIESINFSNIINSKYSPLTESDLINPANEEVKCNTDVSISIYRDEDYVYYYKISKSELNCLLDTETFITNLPNGGEEC